MDTLAVGGTSLRPDRRVPALVFTLLASVGVAFLARPLAQQLPAPSAPQDRQTFKSEVELVEVDVFPSLADGRIVTTLTRDDFEILEDGRPQAVATFEFINIPIAGTDTSRASLATGASASDVQVNAATGRLYVIVLDDVHTTRAYSSHVQSLATRFVERWLEPGDVAAVIYTSGNGSLSQGFTSDKTRLLKSVRRFQGASAGGTREAVATLKDLSEYLGGFRGRRKICVYLSQGFPSPSRASTFKDLTDAANRGNVSMYTMGAGGLTELATLVTADQPSVVQGHERTGTETRLRAERAREAGMRWLADATGGFAIVGTNDLDRGLDRIRTEASSYYLLGYYPTTTRRPGAEHKITVRLRNGPGVSVRARPGYVEPSSASGPAPALLVARDVPPRLLPALQYPMTQAGMRLSVTASPFMDEAGSPWASVTVELDGHDLDLSPSGALDVAVLALDPQGIVRGHDVRRLQLSFEAETRTRILEGGLRTQARVRVVPGVAGFRIAAADGSGLRVASVWFDLDVPEFGRVPLSMSGIVLSNSHANEAPTANADEDLRAALQAPASTRRRFTRADSIAWLVEIYRTATEQTGTEITTTIRNAADAREVFRQQRPASGEDRIARVVERTSLEAFAAGAYVLRVEARLAGAHDAVSRELTFQVVDAGPGPRGKAEDCSARMWEAIQNLPMR